MGNVRRLTIRVWLPVVLVGLVGLTGCHRSLYLASLERREKHLHDLLEQAMSLERRRPMNRERLAKLTADLHELYQERLRLTLEMIEEQSAEDVKNWRDSADERKEWTVETFDGDGEKIQQSVADMTY